MKQKFPNKDVSRNLNRYGSAHSITYTLHRNDQLKLMYGWPPTITAYLLMQMYNRGDKTMAVVMTILQISFYVIKIVFFSVFVFLRLISYILFNFIISHDSSHTCSPHVQCPFKQVYNDFF